MNGCAPDLALIERLQATRKWATYLMPSKAERNIWGHHDSALVLLNEEGKFVENLPVETNEKKRRLEAAIRSDILYLFGQGNPFFLLGKSRNFEKRCLGTMYFSLNFVINPLKTSIFSVVPLVSNIRHITGFS